MSGLDYPQPRLYIDGEWRETATTTAVVGPGTGDEIGRVAHASAADLDDAVAAARRGFVIWSRTAPAERARIIREAARLVRERADRIARIITAELGKLSVDSAAEVQTAAGLLEWNADEGRRAYGRLIPGAVNRRQMVAVEPIGPVAAFAPWNVPMIAPARKISAALAAGCSVIIKPAEETPGAALCLAEAFADAGLPPGVLGMVFGDPGQISQHLVDSPVIRAVTFTGSTRIGRELAARAAGQLKRAVMELGGHAPVIVCEDADPVQVATGAARAAYRGAGQVCVSPTRFLVADGRYDEFVDALTSRVGALNLGAADDPATDVGPVANERRLAELEGLVADAVAHGARIATGGRRSDRPGFYFEPTVLADVAPQCRVFTVEPFGPLATVTRFDDLDSALELANLVPFGLAGYIFTGDAGAVRRLGNELDCGAIAVNHWQVSGPETPFGGHKDSGFGSEGGIEGLAAFQQIKYISEE